MSPLVPMIIISLYIIASDNRRSESNPGQSKLTDPCFVYMPRVSGHHADIMAFLFKKSYGILFRKNPRSLNNAMFLSKGSTK